jgi:dinuclear metal center YbgI/SA1388 family protein
MLLADYIAKLEQLWPSVEAEDWDVVGLVSGDLAQNINRVLLTVDVTHEVIEQAKSESVDLIIAHHPLLLKGINTVAENTAKGSVLSQLIKADIALYAIHTNADVAIKGTSVVLGEALDLKDMVALVRTTEGKGIGVIGDIQACELADLASRLNQVLPATATGVRVAGDFRQKISRVALCAGAGDSYLQSALDSGADVYITSDLRHHPAQEILEQAKARGLNFALIDISHWAAEFLWLAQLEKEIASFGIDVVISDLRTDVFDFLMNAPRQA